MADDPANPDPPSRQEPAPPVLDYTPPDSFREQDTEPWPVVLRAGAVVSLAIFIFVFGGCGLFARGCG